MVYGGDLAIEGAVWIPSTSLVAVLGLATNDDLYLVRWPEVACIIHNHQPPDISTLSQTVGIPAGQQAFYDGIMAWNTNEHPTIWIMGRAVLDLVVRLSDLTREESTSFSPR